MGREDRAKADVGRIMRGVGNENELERLETGGGDGRETGSPAPTEISKLAQYDQE